MLSTAVLLLARLLGLGTFSLSRKSTEQKLELVGRKGTGQWSCASGACGKTNTSSDLGLHADGAHRTNNGVESPMVEASPPSHPLPRHEVQIATNCNLEVTEIGANGAWIIGVISRSVLKELLTEAEAGCNGRVPLRLGLSALGIAWVHVSAHDT